MARLLSWYMCRFNIHIIMGNYVVLDEHPSDYDRNHVGNGHGGVPVNMHYPKLGAIDTSKPGKLKQHRVGGLVCGSNKVGLMYVSGIPNITQLGIRFPKPVSGTVTMRKSSMIKKDPPSPHIMSIDLENNAFVDLMDYRTLFVAYRDTYTTLHILLSNDIKEVGTLEANCTESQILSDDSASDEEKVYETGSEDLD